MCFSPQASFSAAALLAGIGTITLAKAWRHDRRMLLLAGFPLIWAAHQGMEGMVWLTVDTPSDGGIYKYPYFAVAALFWPMLCPAGVALAEDNLRIRRLRWALFVCGTALVGYVGHFIATFGIDASVAGHSLCYTSPAPRPPIYADLVYATITLLPLILSSRRMVKLFGLGLAIAWGVTFTMLHEVYFSTWCFAAALLSVILFFAIRSQPAAQPPNA